tara:strand:+ start:684 stop:1340 length:657 start_codon:yes stop_codon:yes gene_type:complete
MTNLQTPKSKAGRPTKNRANGSKKIKKAALYEFARGGFQGTSISQIAETAGVARPLIQHHFSGKEDLWKRAVSENYEKFIASLKIAKENFIENDAEHNIQLLSETLVKFASENPFLIRIITDETRQNSDRAAWIRERYLLPVHVFAASLVESMMSKSSLKELNSIQANLIPVIFGALNFPFIDSDTISEVYAIDVYSKKYIQEHSNIISKLIKTLLMN